MTLKINTRYCN